MIIWETCGARRREQEEIFNRKLSVLPNNHIENVLISYHKKAYFAMSDFR